MCGSYRISRGSACRTAGLQPAHEAQGGQAQVSTQGQRVRLCAKLAREARSCAGGDGSSKLISPLAPYSFSGPDGVHFLNHIPTSVCGVLEAPPQSLGSSRNPDGSC